MDTIDLSSAAERLAALVANITDEQLTRPTPCPAYTLGDLIDHVGGLTLAFTAAARKQTNQYSEMQPSGVAARLTDDWRARIPRDLARLAQAWREPEAWSGTTRIVGGDAPARVVGLSAANELVVHGWDVAQACGQPYESEPHALAASREFLEMVANPDAPAGPDVAFGPSRQVTDGATPLDRVVALSGRDPAWTKHRREPRADIS